ncbi:MAG: AAA family ATPase [Gaiellaceae bacterium]
MSQAGATAAPEEYTAEVDLTPFVPRVVIEWLREMPESRQRTLEGTLAFVDISGFTAMSERLARKGKLGAEEVTEVMNDTFTRLLDFAYTFGGGLIKFGGDALLLFFSGAGHEGRACDAAHGMRRALRELGPPQTSAGRVTLKMHVGVHSGSFEFFLVGESHRELLLAGEGVTRTVEMEAGAEAGEILVSPATAAALPVRALGKEKAGGRLIKAAPGTDSDLAPLPPFKGVDVSVCVSASIRRHLEAGKDEPEHRQASVAFLRFDLDGLDGGELCDALEELVLVAQRVCEEHGTSFLETDIDKDGGKIILVAGAPQTEGDDDERILRTVRGIADAAPRLPLRIGVSRGRVFAGEVGAPFRRTYTILGTTAALAARLMAKAERGQILTTPDVLERSRTPFDTAELEPLRLKGIAEPVQAHSVLALAPAREKAATAESRLPFVGRERELAILSAALAPVRMGFGNLVELIGEPGMGKSRLVEELREQAADLSPVTTACAQYEASTAYFAFRGLLRSLLELPANGAAGERLRERVEELEPELLPWLPLVALPLDVTVEPTREVEELQPAFRRARLHGVVETLLSKLLPEPTLLVIEDVHWMDEASSELLRHLGGQVSSKPWLVCATRRPVEGGFSAAEGVPPVPAMTVHLEPLAPEAAKELVDAAAEQGLLQHEVSAITDRAGGNPLFLQELVVSSRAPEEEALPESVESVVAARIDKLPPGDRALLRYAAVLGATFSAELVGDVLADDPSTSADSEAWDRLAEFVERDPYMPSAFRFRHALFRDAAYEGLSFRRRRELHARVGEAYERRDPEETGEFVELLSLHFFHAGDNEKTFGYSLLAGERARAKYANVEAAAFYRRAVEVARKLPELDPDELASVWEALGDVSEMSGLYADAAEAYKSGRKLSAHPRLLLKEGVIRDRLSRYSEALRWYRRALDAAESLDEEERTQTKLEIGLAYAGTRYRQGEFADSIDWGRRVVDEANDAGNLPALAHAYYLLHLAYTSMGSPEKKAFRGLALPIYEEIGDLVGLGTVLNNLGIEAYYEGRWQEALDLYERGRDARERSGDVIGVAASTNNIGEIKSDQGYLETAAELFQEVHDTCSAAGSSVLAALADSNLGRVDSRAGRFDDALRRLRHSLAVFHEIRAGSFVLETKARLAERAILADDPTEALRQADETLRASDATGSVGVLGAMLHRLRAYALMQSGDLDGAEAALEQSLAIARERDELYELALSLEAAARLAELRGDDGTAAAEESKALLARLGVVSTPAVPLP